ncbi:MAG TPA: hypothetical protein PLJ74_13070 [Myxococcota bacterium]|nr:hypothetical protein [Myxococcota bacterium]
MQKLLTLWGMIDSKYGPWVAGFVVLAVIGIAYYLRLTPAQVFQWLGW